MDRLSIELLYKFANSKESETELADMRRRISDFLNAAEQTEINSKRQKEQYGRIAATHILGMGSTPGGKRVPETMEIVIAEAIVNQMDEKGLSYEIACEQVGEMIGRSARDVGKYYRDHQFDVRSKKYWFKNDISKDSFRDASSFIIKLINNKQAFNPINEFSITPIQGSFWFDDTVENGHIHRVKILYIKIKSIKLTTVKSDVLTENNISKICESPPEVTIKEFDIIISEFFNLSDLLFRQSDIYDVLENGSIKKFEGPKDRKPWQLKFYVGLINQM